MIVAMLRQGLFRLDYALPYPHVVVLELRDAPRPRGGRRRLGAELCDTDECRDDDGNLPHGLLLKGSGSCLAILSGCRVRMLQYKT